MNWQSRLEKTAIALTMIGLGFGFCILGILANGGPAGGSCTNGILGIVIGALFLLSSFYFCKRGWGDVNEEAGKAVKTDLKSASYLR